MSTTLFLRGFLVLLGLFGAGSLVCPVNAAPGDSPAPATAPASAIRGMPDAGGNGHPDSSPVIANANHSGAAGPDAASKSLPTPSVQPSPTPTPTTQIDSKPAATPENVPTAQPWPSRTPPPPRTAGSHRGGTSWWVPVGGENSGASETAGLPAKGSPTSRASKTALRHSPRPASSGLPSPTPT